MSFTSDFQVVLNKQLDAVFESFSTPDMFIKSMKLSPTTVSIDILKQDQVYLDSELRYKGHDAQTPDTEACTRLHFHLVEKIKTLGITNKPEVLGTQIISKRQRLHLYESVANGGLVSIRKVRRFSATDTSTTISECITGKTFWLLKSYVEGQCRAAHHGQMKLYPTLAL